MTETTGVTRGKTVQGGPERWTKTTHVDDGCGEVIILEKVLCCGVSTTLGGRSFTVTRSFTLSDLRYFYTVMPKGRDIIVEKGDLKYRYDEHRITRRLKVNNRSVGVCDRDVTLRL